MKLVWKSLKTATFSVAKQRLPLKPVADFRDEVAAALPRRLAA